MLTARTVKVTIPLDPHEIARLVACKASSKARRSSRLSLSLRSGRRSPKLRQPDASRLNHLRAGVQIKDRQV
jgi:hypothetical protein